MNKALVLYLQNKYSANWTLTAVLTQSQQVSVQHLRCPIGGSDAWRSDGPLRKKKCDLRCFLPAWSEGRRSRGWRWEPGRRWWWAGPSTTPPPSGGRPAAGPVQRLRDTHDGGEPLSADFKPLIDFLVGLVLTEAGFVHIHVDPQHHGAQQVADGRPEDWHRKQDGCRGQSGSQEELCRATVSRHIRHLGSKQTSSVIF